MSERPDETVRAAEDIAEALHRRGHEDQANKLRSTVRHGHVGSMMLEALRETLQVVLTAIEAIDPVSATMVEELRLEVDMRLAEKHGSVADATKAGGSAETA